MNIIQCCKGWGRVKISKWCKGSSSYLPLYQNRKYLSVIKIIYYKGHLGLSILNTSTTYLQQQQQNNPFFTGHKLCPWSYDICFQPVGCIGKNPSDMALITKKKEKKKWRTMFGSFYNIRLDLIQSWNKWCRMMSRWIKSHTIVHR